MAPGAGLAPEPVAAADAQPPVEIGDAVAVTRTGPLAPAPIEELVVVQVSVNVCGVRSVGSGVLIAADLVATAAHVVGDAALVRVDLPGVTVTGEVLGVAIDGRDVALVAVDAPLDRPLAIAPPPQVGEAVTVVARPEVARREVAVGPRVALADTVARLAPNTFGVDVVTEPGSSGGPAVDADGTLVGIVSSRETATGTALVVALADAGRLDASAMVPGACPVDA